jgi:uncharacterized membrane protein YqjE
MIPMSQWQLMKIAHLRGRMIVTIVLPIVTLLFLIIWFFFQADRYTIYQNIAIFFVAILFMGGVLGVIWSHWKSSFGGMEEQFEQRGKKIGEEIERSFGENQEE